MNTIIKDKILTHIMHVVCPYLEDSKKQAIFYKIYSYFLKSAVILDSSVISVKVFQR